jgi:hypothetical protein
MCSRLSWCLSESPATTVVSLAARSGSGKSIKSRNMTIFPSDLTIKRSNGVLFAVAKIQKICQFGKESLNRNQ